MGIIEMNFIDTAMKNTSIMEMPPINATQK